MRPAPHTLTPPKLLHRVAADVSDRHLIRRFEQDASTVDCRQDRQASRQGDKAVNVGNTPELPPSQPNTASADKRRLAKGSEVITCHIAQACNGHTASAGQIDWQVSIPWVPIVPPHKFPGRQHAW